MKILLILSLLLITLTVKSQIELDSIPVKERALNDCFRYKVGERLSINFNQYLRFDGEVVLNKKNGGMDVLRANSKESRLLLTRVKYDSGLLIVGRMLLNDSLGTIYELHSNEKGYYFERWINKPKE